MIKKPILAQAISVVFHPILWTFYVLVFMSYSYHYVFTKPEGMWAFLGTGFFMMVVAPLLMILLLIKIKVVTSLEINERRERSLPMFIVGLSYYLSYTVFKSIHLPDLFNLLLLGSTMLVIIAMLITFFWKISLHLLSLGGILGFFLAIGFRYNINFLIVIIPLVFIAGLVGYARLKLEAHTPSQVYLGFTIGAFVMFLVFILL
jgi:membrane-associated phospholipid phosphatase